MDRSRKAAVVDRQEAIPTQLLRNQVAPNLWSVNASSGLTVPIAAAALGILYFCMPETREQIFEPKFLNPLQGARSS
jgi:hypothetical protein